MNNNLHNMIGDVIDNVASLREVLVREASAPWITSEIKNLQRRRSKLYRIFTRTGFAYKEYANLRKLIKSRIIAAKKNYFDMRINTCKNSKSLWNDFRNLGLIRRFDSVIPSDLDLCGLNDYFVNCATFINDEIDYDYLDSCTIKCNRSFNFKELDNLNVRSAIMRLSSGAIGPDGFTIKTYKVLLP